MKIALTASVHKSIQERAKRCRIRCWQNGREFLGRAREAGCSIDQSAVHGLIAASERANRAAEPRQLRQSFSSMESTRPSVEGPISKSIDKFFRQLHRTARPVARPLEKLPPLCNRCLRRCTVQPPIRHSVSINHQPANFPKNKISPVSSIVFDRFAR